MRALALFLLLLTGVFPARQARVPKPEPAIPAVLTALDDFDVVAIGDMDRNPGRTAWQHRSQSGPAFLVAARPRPM